MSDHHMPASPDPQPVPEDDTLKRLQQAGQMAKYKTCQLILAKIAGGAIPTPGELKMLNSIQAEIAVGKPSGDSVPDDPAPAHLAAGIDELAAHYGKSVRTVYRWIDQGMPALPDGSYDLDAVDAWRRMRKGGGSAKAADAGFTPDAPPDKPQVFDDKDFWDKESKKEQALYRQWKRRKDQGEYIKWSVIEERIIARILEVKTFMFGFERTLPPLLINCRTDRQMSDVIRKELRKGFEQFSKIREIVEDTRPRDEGPGD